ncbi:TetR family transcriptional regulator C-terminal domain-containing protein, partial [Streptomyces sp. NPDC059513]|uniref:TetR family transcriptional regulator C-terminal domain-containing protein n=1 Tax=Streptomyces sp. NPDC059513 TaxID=3346853 RepID=UPI0036C7C527
MASSPAPFSVPRAAPATVRARWSAYVEETVSGPRAAGEIAEDTDVPQLAFEIAALLEPANTPSVPHNEFSSPQPLSGDRAHVPAGTCAAALLPPAPAYADTPTGPPPAPRTGAGASR